MQKGVIFTEEQLAALAKVKEKNMLYRKYKGCRANLSTFIDNYHKLP